MKNVQNLIISANTLVFQKKIKIEIKILEKERIFFHI